MKNVFYQVETYLEKLAKTDEFEKVIQQFEKKLKQTVLKKFGFQGIFITLANIYKN